MMAANLKIAFKNCQILGHGDSEDFFNVSLRGAGLVPRSDSQQRLFLFQNLEGFKNTDEFWQHFYQIFLEVHDQLVLASIWYQNSLQFLASVQERYYSINKIAVSGLFEMKHFEDFFFPELLEGEASR